jgi:DNA primase
MGWIDDFVGFAQGQLDDRVREALWARGVSDEQIQSFQLGYVDRSLPDLPFSTDFREWSGSGSKLEDSYVLPLTNPLGQILGLQFRSVERGTSGYMDYFLTRAEPVLFGLGQAMPFIWREETALVVEGGFDLFPVQRVLPYAFSTLTSKVGETVLRMLRRLVRQVYLFYDADSAGRSASRDFVKETGPEFARSLDYPHPMVTLPNGKAVKDPADLWEAWGDEQLAPYLRAQISE